MPCFAPRQARDKRDDDVGEKNRCRNSGKRECRGKERWPLKDGSYKIRKSKLAGRPFGVSEMRRLSIRAIRELAL
jgi:hypothetical protein